MSRVMQAIIQYGSNEQKSAVLHEMIPKLVEICKTPYGHFTILKAVTYCRLESDQKKICSALSGHFVSLGTNLIGARAVESILHIYPNKLTKSLKAEFYGKVSSYLAFNYVYVSFIS